MRHEEEKKWFWVPSASAPFRTLKQHISLRRCFIPSRLTYAFPRFPLVASWSQCYLDFCTLHRWPSVSTLVLLRLRNSDHLQEVHFSLPTNHGHCCFLLYSIPGDNASCMCRPSQALSISLAIPTLSFLQNQSEPIIANLKAISKLPCSCPPHPSYPVILPQCFSF